MLPLSGFETPNRRVYSLLATPTTPVFLKQGYAESLGSKNVVRGSQKSSGINTEVF